MKEGKAHMTTDAISTMFIGLILLTIISITSYIAIKHWGPKEFENKK